MEQVAQTNLQLYNQLKAQGYNDEDLRVIHRAYEFLTTIYSGYYQADGKPFVAHTVGVASILGHLSFPVDFVATGLLHNVYGNGDFGDGLRNVATKRRRGIVRNEVGECIEGLIDRFPRCRINRKDISNTIRRIARLDETDRKLMVMDLADYLEKYVDLGVCYWGDGRSPVAVATKHGEQLVATADQLGYPRLAAMLAEAFDKVRTSQVADFLRRSSGCKELELVVPRSCRRGVRFVLNLQLRVLRQRLRRKNLIVSARSWAVFGSQIINGLRPRL
jgi:(p)ppGpp synthase/HD superfamily hydrolase